jgi:hypothetical protein
MELARTTWLFFATHLRRIVRTKRTLACVVIALVPALIALFVLSVHRRGSSSVPPRIEVFAYPAWFLLLQIVTPVLALLMGSAVISEEIDDRTITFPFSRPVPRASLLLGRWLATALLVATLLGASSWLLAFTAQRAGAGPPSSELTREIVAPVIAMAIAGGIVYSALFAVIGVFLRHPMIVGLGYCFVIEELAPYIPGRSRSLSLQDYLRGYVYQSSTYWERINEDLFKSYDSRATSLIVLASILVLALAIGSFAIRRREYVLEA